MIDPELQNIANEITTETRIGANTAQKIGALFSSLIEKILPVDDIAQSAGTSTTKVMSQVAVRTFVYAIRDAILKGSGFNLDSIQFNPATETLLTNIGQLRWNAGNQTLEIKCSNDVTLSIGQENYIRGKNAETTQILNGKVVYVSGGQGANSLIKRASNNNTTGERVIGVATQNIGPNNIGFVTTNGIVNEINTSAFAEGDVLWLGVDGALTNVKPGTDVNQICIGVVLRSHATQGSLLVSVKDDWRGQVAQLRSDLNYYNISESKPIYPLYYTLGTATPAVPDDIRKNGFVLQFFTSKFKDVIYKFHGEITEWDNEDKWIRCNPVSDNILQNMKISKIVNDSGTIAATIDWDSSIFSVTPETRYKIEGRMASYIVFFENEPMGVFGESVISVMQSGNSNNNIKYFFTPPNCHYVAVNFQVTNNNIDYYKNLSVKKIEYDVDIDIVPIKDYVDTSRFRDIPTDNFDFFHMKVSPSSTYIIVGIPYPIKYVQFYDNIPASESFISEIEDVELGWHKEFTCPDNCHYIGIVVYKTGIETTNDDYDRAIIYNTKTIYNKYLIQKPIITCIGDSITEGNFAQDADSYPRFLAKLLPDFQIVNCGVGGETSLQIAGRQGGVPMYLKNEFTVTGVGQVINIGDVNELGVYSFEGVNNNSKPIALTLSRIDRDTSKINPIIIDNITFNLSVSGSVNNNDYELTATVLDIPTKVATPHIVCSRSIISTLLMRNFRKSYASVIFVGTNDAYEEPSILVNRIKKMIEYIGHKNVIVITQWSDVYRTLAQLIAIEDAIEMEFGSLSLNLRKYAVYNAWRDANITLSEGDAIRVQNGLIPTSLTIDGLHPNQTMYELLAYKIFEKMKNNGII